MPVQYDHDHNNEITLFGETNYRNQRRRFGIKTDDRRRHMYILGKTGMGKTTLLENLILQDIQNGHGCCYIDPHGDTAENILNFIPAHRINDVVYFNPADTAYPVGFNIFETENEDQKTLIAGGLMGVFKKIWPDVWSARMEYILMNCVLALLDYPGATLLGINRLLVDKEYRARVIAKIRDPIIKTFWVAEFASWSEKYATEAIAPVQNKVGQFLSSSIIRNMVAQVKSTVNLRRVMDDGKILIANLSKGRIGEDNMRLLGGMLVTKLQLAAQERQDIENIEDRRDFYLFVDEFQNFANESFASILSEARKYRLNLVVAHQYIEQLDEKVAPAIFGNVGTIIVMRVGGADAEVLETEFAPTFIPEDLVNLAKYEMYLKLMVDGVATPPFSARSLPPIAARTENRDKVIAVSRERYAEPRAIIEEKVLKWSGMEASQAISFQPQAEPSGWEVASEAVPAVGLATAAAFQYPAIKTAEEQGAEAAPSALTPAPAPPVEEEEYLKINPERLAAIQASVVQRKSSKPQFAHVCSRCGKTFYLAIQLDPSRPMYCPECRPIVQEERKKRGGEIKKMKRTFPPPEGADAEIGEASFAGQSIPAGENRPRVTRNPDVALAPPKITIVTGETEEPDDLLSEILRSKGDKVELRKKVLEGQAGEGLAAPPEAPKKKRRRRKKKSGSVPPAEPVQS